MYKIDTPCVTSCTPCVYASLTYIQETGMCFEAACTSLLCSLFVCASCTPCVYTSSSLKLSIAY